MPDPYFDRCKKIASDYIKNIMFIDDKITFGDISGSSSSDLLNAKAITSKFAEINIACSFYQYDEIRQQEYIVRLLSDSDVCVIDWKMIANDINIVTTPMMTEEEDVEDSGEGRGYLAAELIRSLIAAQSDLPKVIVIYTSEITENIISLLNLENGQIVDSNTWKSTNDKIIVKIIYKKTLVSEASEEGIRKNTVAYDDLPNRILDIFVSQYAGFLPCFAISSISAIRNKTALILSKFNRSIDPAIAVQRALNSEPDNTRELLHNTIISSIDSILQYAEAESFIFDREFTLAWIKNHGYKSAKVKMTTGQDCALEDEHMLNWIMDGDKERKLKNYKNSPDNVTAAFTPEDHTNLHFNEDFAMLSQNKSHFSIKSSDKILSLGTVLAKYDETSATNEYYLCIQQRCDSTRIGSQENRNFLFLPLEVTEIKGSDLFFLEDEQYKYLKLKSSNCYNIQLFGFVPHAGETVIKTKNDGNGKAIFTGKMGDFVWLFEISDTLSQAILNKYAANLSRVGLSQSEWSRIKTDKK